MEDLKHKTDERSQITVAFVQTSKADTEIPAPSSGHKRAQTPRTWLGHVLRDNHSAEYLKLRDELSEASYWGDLETVFNMIEKGSEL